MSKYKLVFSDLDGTLLLPDMTVSEENKFAIKEMNKLGVHFVASSGRAYKGIPKEITENPDIRYVISSNGAIIYDKAENSAIINRTLPKNLSDRAVDIAFDYDVLMMAHYKGDTYYDAKNLPHKRVLHYNMNSYFEEYINKSAVIVDDIGDFCKKTSEIEMFTLFFHSKEELGSCVRKFLEAGEYIIASSAPYNIEVFYKKSGKGNALSALAKHLGIEISDTIAVGDSINDITMIDMAGLGLAVDNAFPELKEKADKTICSFLDHIAKYILENYIK